MKIRFCGTVNDSSGYGEFARYFISALHGAGHKVAVEPINGDPKPGLNFGSKGELCKTLQKRVSRPDVNIVNMVPSYFKKFSLPNTTNIGFTMWEADKLPDIWVKQCNEMDAIFVPCTWNKDVFESSGVTVPVFVIKPGVDKDDIPEKVERDEKIEDTFHFYSVFQWLERKNPQGLLRAYFSAFDGVDDVTLTLKTYRHARFRNNKEILLKEIEAIRESMNLSQPPRVSLITEFLPHDAMAELHRKMHCFVLPHRAEGFGMPHMDAMLYGNPAISTNFSGNTDFMLEDNSYLLPCHLTPVRDMRWLVPWYSGTMLWGEPDLGTLIKHMKFVYNNRDEAFEKGNAGREFIINNFTPENSAKMIKEACKEILNKEEK